MAFCTLRSKQLTRDVGCEKSDTNTKEQREREVDVMSTSVILRTDEVKFIKEMENYVIKLKKQQIESRKNAYNDAKKALLRTGVVTRSGKTKKKIVSWE